MRTVSMQGTQLTSADRRRIEQQRSVQASMQSVLQSQVNQTLAEMERRKEEGIKPEKQWFLVQQESWIGTLSIAEWMGYTSEPAQLGQLEAY